MYIYDILETVKIAFPYTSVRIHILTSTGISCACIELTLRSGVRDIGRAFGVVFGVALGMETESDFMRVRVGG